MTLRNNELQVTLHSFHDDGSCLADVILPVSQTKVCNFVVKHGLGNGVIVHMPSEMGTTWTYTELSWADVRQKITESFRNQAGSASTPKNEEPIRVVLYGFDAFNNCMADITIKSTGVEVRGLKVNRGIGNDVIVHMPDWMRTKWSRTEIQWSTVRYLVTEKYRAKMAESLPSFYFYGHYRRTQTTATVTFPITGTVVESVFVTCEETANDSIRVFMPRSMNHQWLVEEMDWDTVSAYVEEEYRRQLLHSSGGEREDIIVHFDVSNKEFGCLVDVSLPNKQNYVKGFRLHHGSQGQIKIAMPTWMERWSDSQYSWFTLCKLIIRAYINSPEGSKVAPKLTPAPVNNQSSAAINTVSLKPAAKTIPVVTEAAPEFSARMQPAESQDVQLLTEKTQKETSELGRILNADNNPFMFYPHTVLRLEPPKFRKSMIELVNAITRGSVVGIGPFEINLLMWVEKLRYVTKSMLLKLIENGYVSIGWRPNINAKKMTDVLKKMQEYNLIELSKFVMVDDNGEQGNDNHQLIDENAEQGDIKGAKYLIVTVGKTGNTLLHELGKNTRSYNPFDILQDGNNVKRYLSANQWLIHWLTTYKDRQDMNYETSCIIQQKGSEFIGARFYATVTLNDMPMVCEPIRRCEEFEIAALHAEVHSKMDRLTSMFGNLDQLYKGREEFVFSQRPTIVLICEDDEHIAEVRDMFSDIVENNPEQRFWFTTDQRVYNKNMKSQRFLSFENGEPVAVDENEFFHIN